MNTGRTGERLSALVLLGPCLLLMAGFLAPLAAVMLEGASASQLPLAWKTLYRVEFATIELALIVAAIATALASSVALLTSTLRARSRRIVYFVCLVPLGVNIAFRVFGVEYLLAPHDVSRLLGFNPPSILFTRWATVTGLVHWTFPVAAMLMFAATAKLDFSLLDAAMLLGAPKPVAVTRTVLPQLVTPLITTATVVFCLAYGSFITPAALGGIEDVTVTRLIGDLMNEGRTQEASIAAIIALATPLLAFAVPLVTSKLLRRRRSGVALAGSQV